MPETEEHSNLVSILQDYIAEKFLEGDNGRVLTDTKGLKARATTSFYRRVSYLTLMPSEMIDVLSSSAKPRRRETLRIRIVKPSLLRF